MAIHTTVAGRSTALSQRVLREDHPSSNPHVHEQHASATYEKISPGAISSTGFQNAAVCKMTESELLIHIQR